MSDKVVCPRCRWMKRVLDHQREKSWCALCKGKFSISAELAAAYRLRFDDQFPTAATMEQFLREYYKNDI